MSKPGLDKGKGWGDSNPNLRDSKARLLHPLLCPSPPGPGAATGRTRLPSMARGSLKKNVQETGLRGARLSPGINPKGPSRGEKRPHPATAGGGGRWEPAPGSTASGAVCTKPAARCLSGFVPRTRRVREYICSFCFNKSVCFCRSRAAWKEQCVQASEVETQNSNSAGFIGLTAAGCHSPPSPPHQWSPGDWLPALKALCFQHQNKQRTSVFSLFSFFLFFPSFSPVFFPSSSGRWSCLRTGKSISERRGLPLPRT